MWFCYILSIKATMVCQNNNQKLVRANYIYRIISSKKQRGKPYQTDLPILENDITTFEPTSKLGIHSRYQRSDNKQAGSLVTLPV